MKVMAIREQLRPYIVEQYRQAAAAGTPVVRPLFFDFTSDASAAAVDDQMMFGPRFLVAPQMVANASTPPVCPTVCACVAECAPSFSHCAAQPTETCTCRRFLLARAGGIGSLHRYTRAAKVSERVTVRGMCGSKGFQRVARQLHKP